MESRTTTEQLLSEAAGGSSLLSGVKIFPSTYANSWNEIQLFAASFSFFALAVLLLFAKSSALVIFFLFAIAGFIFAIGKFVQREALNKYETAVRTANWQEGVLVFPTKDVVVRFHRPGFHMDREFASGSIYQVRAIGNKHLEIIAHNELSCLIKAKYLTQTPTRIAEEMRRILGISMSEEEEAV